MTILIVFVIGVASNYFVNTISISSFKIFDTVNLFTYFGVLIGFALTIYTFGLSMVSDIKSKIDIHKNISEDRKKKIYSKLVRGFSEIKEDIWIIFVSIIIVIGFEIANEIPNPFGWRVEDYNIPETVNLTLFITTTIAMFDIMQTLFNLSEINLHLNKYEQHDKN
ncbi:MULTISPECIES: hypothetical protein [Flavobacterium]|uniref:Uncharacterized protein n=1 Tax=Flavobacterium keumense TaxID=1306518 RepID=A0ABY8N5U5_9FLAO|nr:MULTISPECIES: hypothetical protein [Flavobacterium]WGK94558.1 hypothetical protein MG292_10820 [Flavobacterium keumense]